MKNNVFVDMTQREARVSVISQAQVPRFLLNTFYDKIITAKPEIHDHSSSPNYIDVQEGQTVKIWCNVSGTPEPTVRWKRYLGRKDAATGR